MNKKVLLAVAAALVTVACQPVVSRITVDNGYTNVRDMGHGYMHYEIMDGENMITCREHKTRIELTCWPTIETYPDEGF